VIWQAHDPFNMAQMLTGQHLTTSPLRELGSAHKHEACARASAPLTATAEAAVRRAAPCGDDAAARSRVRTHGTGGPTATSATQHVWYRAGVVKTTIYMPDELHRELKLAAKERGTSEAELIRTAVRHELLGAPPGQAERAQRRARLLAATGTLDKETYPPGYLDELRAGWRS